MRIPLALFMFGMFHLCYIKAPINKGNTLFYVENQQGSM